MKFLDKKGRPFLSNRFLTLALILVGIFALGFPYPIFKSVGVVSFYVFLLALFADIIFLYWVNYDLSVERIVEEQLSNGEENPIQYVVKGSFLMKPQLELIDEYPIQLQLRNKGIKVIPFDKEFETDFKYPIYPKTRGEYHFGNINVLLSSGLGLIHKKIIFQQKQTVRVYPSIIQYKKYNFLAFTNRLSEVGIKKIRKVGSSTEFEQIKGFQRGDNVKRINWKATARRDELMVNHYQDEKAQNIYFVIDKGRMMHMPFNGLSLFDYAVNSTLALAGVAKEKGDKVGLITFSDIIGSWITANSRTNHISIINEALYHQKIRMKESDYLRLYKNVRTKIKGRSLLVLFTNFNSIISLKRQMKYLKALSKSHLVLVVSFENEEVKKVADEKAYTLEGYFDQSIAEKFLQEKSRIAYELRLMGIYSIVTPPSQLTVNTINKYLEIKSRGLL